jgi:hypothetical protein
LEFLVAGTPVSLQGKRASIDRWKNEVADAAQRRIQSVVDWTYLQPEPLALTIFYFPVAAMGGDVDNIVKPILDALIGVVYVDDQIVERVTVQKFEPTASWSFANPSEQLAAALDLASIESLPVVYVHVVNDLNWRRL